MTPVYMKANCEVCGDEFTRSKSEMVRSLKRSLRLTCARCRAATHNLSKSQEYKSWSAMKRRCNNLNQKCYDRYGGRGITYDTRWNKFENFIFPLTSKLVCGLLVPIPTLPLL